MDVVRIVQSENDIGGRKKNCPESLGRGRLQYLVGKAYLEPLLSFHLVGHWSEWDWSVLPQGFLFTSIHWSAPQILRPEWGG